MMEPEKKRTQIYLVDKNCDGKQVFDLLFAYAEAREKYLGIDYKVLFTPSLIWEINGRMPGETTVIQPSSRNAYQHIKNRSTSRRAASRKALIRDHQDHIIVSQPTDEEREVLGTINKLARKHRKTLRDMGDVSGDALNTIKGAFKAQLAQGLNGKDRDFADRAIKHWFDQEIGSMMNNQTDLVMITRDGGLVKDLLTRVREEDSEDVDVEYEDAASNHFEHFTLSGFIEHVDNEVNALKEQHPEVENVVEKVEAIKKKIKQDKNGYDHKNESAFSRAYNRQEALLAERKERDGQDGEVRR